MNAPCVASCSAGNAAQLLDDGRHGLLVDPADSAAMARAMARQIDPATRIRPGNRIAMFDSATVSAAWRALVAELAAERQAATRRQPAKISTAASNG